MSYREANLSICLSGVNFVIGSPMIDFWLCHPLLYYFMNSNNVVVLQGMEWTFSLLGYLPDYSVPMML